MRARHREPRVRRNRVTALSTGFPAAAPLALGALLGLGLADRTAAFDLFGPDNPPVPPGNTPDSGESRDKLNLGLDTLSDEYQAHLEALAQGQAGTSFASRRTTIDTPGDRVTIDAIATNDAAALAAALEALGAEVHAVAGRIVSATLPLDQLSALGDAAELAFAQPAMTMSWAGSVTSQGDPGQRSDLGRANHGVDGTGTVVGVISDSYDCFGADGLANDAAADIATGDLPASGVVVVLDDAAPGCSGSNIDEGRAMAQIVHDVAPGAGIAFHTANGGQAVFAQGILDLQSVANADVIVDDIIYFAEPMFQDGIIAQAVQTVVGNGSAYFSAAGNNAREAYQAAFNDSGQPGLNGGTLHDFDPGPGVDTRLSMQQFTTTTYVLQWQDRYFSVSGAPGAQSDLSICFFDGNIFLGCTSSTNFGKDPIDGGTLGGAGNLDVEIELLSGPVPGLVKFVAFGGIAFNDAYAGTGAGTVYGHANAADANAVGASYYGFNPAFGIDPPVLNDFSSAGNTPIRFDTAGNPVVDDREKPEFTAPDGGDNTFFGSDFEPNGNPNFFGTSAAAPHAAAAAALMLERKPSLTPAQVTTILRDTAIDIVERRDVGTSAFIAIVGAGYDNDSGEGLIDAEAAVAASTPEADLAITKTDSADPVVAGNDLTYRLTITNAGPDPARNVQVSEALPPQVSLVSTTGCSEDPLGAPICTLGTLAAGDATVVELIVNLSAGTPPQTITNIADVSSSASDPNPADNTAAEDTQVLGAPEDEAQADLAIVKTDSADPVIAGNTLTYTVTVNNLGPSAARNVVVTDTLPPQVSGVLATAGCVEDPAGAPDCTIGTLAAGSDATVTLVVEVPAGLAPQSITNNATVSAGTSDPDGSNNTTSETTTVVQAETCDADRDGDIDRNDLREISLSRGQTATGPYDPRDGNGDGSITTSDIRACIPQCDLPHCANP